MRAAGNVEQNAVGGIDGDERRIAQAPIGDLREKLAVVRQMFGDDGEIGVAGAGLGERQTRSQAQSFRRRIDGDQPLGIAALAGDDERARIMRWSCPRDAVGRKPHQPQAREAMTRDRIVARHGSTPTSTTRAGRDGCGRGHL